MFHVCYSRPVRKIDMEVGYLFITSFWHVENVTDELRAVYYITSYILLHGAGYYLKS
jgi:hypothetical protein